MTDETFEGAEINGKRFPFKRLTMTQAMQTRRKLIPGFWRSCGIFIKTLITPYNMKKRWWKRIRSVAFEKNGLWKIGIVPRELRCSVILFEEAEKAEESFFVYYPGIVQESEELLKYRNSLLTTKTDKNETL